MKIRRSAKLARKMLDYANSLVQAGITTEEIDIMTHHEIIAHGAYPSPVNYCGFPKAICTSVNEIVCHGIPDDRRLVEGDMISIDVSLFLDGFHGDNCGTVIVGKSQDSGALYIYIYIIVVLLRSTCCYRLSDIFLSGVYKSQST
jgi:methionyl aminopeptidase